MKEKEWLFYLSVFIYWLSFLYSALAEALTGVGHSSYQSLFVQSWFRCILQTFINQPPETLIRTDAEQTTSMCIGLYVISSNRNLVFSIMYTMLVYHYHHCYHFFALLLFQFVFACLGNWLVAYFLNLI